VRLANAFRYPSGPMAKRRTSGIQRRSRASDEAMTRRLGAGSKASLDWRLLTVGGIVVLGVVVLVLVVVFGGSATADNSFKGTRQVDDGAGIHIQEGTAGTYHSIPGTSGPHWSSADSPGPWGVYTSVQPQERLIHNLEHGGIVIWYQPAQLDVEGVATLTAFVNQQVTTARFKVILAPWGGANFGHAIAVTAWNWLLYLDTANTDAVRTFIDAHYGNAPEPFGGPAQPGT
jgi:Protein of unknown function (DUF3105)